MPFVRQAIWLFVLLLDLVVNSIVRGTLILIRSLSFRVFTYGLCCCIPERLVRLSNCKLQDEERCKIAATQPSVIVCLYEQTLLTTRKNRAYAELLMQISKRSISYELKTC